MGYGAGTGFYLGAKPNGYVETGAYTTQQETNIIGGKGGLGSSLIFYWTDAENIFQGTSDLTTLTFGPVSMTVFYDACGEEIGREFSLWGAGGGLSYETGHSESQLFPLQ